MDGYVRDRTGRPPHLLLWPRGTVPMAGRSDIVPRVRGPILFGAVRVQPGDTAVPDDCETFKREPAFGYPLRGERPVVVQAPRW